MKKKRRLKKWVKVVLFLIGVLLFAKILQWDAEATERAINTCLEKGYSEWECTDIKR